THALHDGLCGSPECLDANRAEQHRMFVERRMRERAEFIARASAARAAAAARKGIANPEQFLLARVPWSGRPLTRLGKRRIAAFREHIARLVAGARARTAHPAVAHPDPRQTSEEKSLPGDVAAVLGGGCGQCRGACCGAGGHYGFVRIDGVERYMRAHPERTDDEVLDAYMGYVPSRTYRDSCIYHARH